MRACDASLVQTPHSFAVTAARTPKRPVGRPPGDRPPKSARERKQLERARLRRQGRVPLLVYVSKAARDQLDELRKPDGLTRDEAVQEVIEAAGRRRRARA